jgi:hypothetical protein
MIGYKFDTKKIADDAMSFLNTHHGLPVNGGVTMFGVWSYSQHADGYYYIAHDAEWTSVLGEPIEITLSTYNI